MTINFLLFSSIKSSSNIKSKVSVLSVSAFVIGWAIEKFNGPITVNQSTPKPTEDLSFGYQRTIIIYTKYVCCI